MSSHLHGVLKVEAQRAQAWSDMEVVKQWHKVFGGTLLTQRFANGEDIALHFIGLLDERIAEYR